MSTSPGRPGVAGLSTSGLFTWWKVCVVIWRGPDAGWSLLGVMDAWTSQRMVSASTAEVSDLMLAGERVGSWPLSGSRTCSGHPQCLSALRPLPERFSDNSDWCAADRRLNKGWEEAFYLTKSSSPGLARKNLPKHSDFQVVDLHARVFGQEIVQKRGEDVPHAPVIFTAVRGLKVGREPERNSGLQSTGPGVASTHSAFIHLREEVRHWQSVKSGIGPITDRPPRPRLERKSQRSKTMDDESEACGGYERL